MLEVRLLGTFEVRNGKTVIDISSRPAQSLFAYLVLHAGVAHRREKLAGMLWPDSLEETARDNLRHALWRIRKTLPSKPKVEYLLTDDLTIAFNASIEYWLDVSVLEKLNEDAPANELISALSVYQGELLPGFYDEWVNLEREHLYSVFENHMSRLMSLLEDEKRWQDILDWAERWIKLGQKPEPAYRALMVAHAKKGDMSKVAATYERCVKALKEFDVEPSDQTKLLYEDLKSGRQTSNDESTSTEPVIKESYSLNIPVPLTSFIGREKEIKEIEKLLLSSRLLTLTGSGGVGKTRLAIQIANSSMKKFKDRVFWIGLSSLSDGNLIPHEIAQSLNLYEASDESLIETIKTYLKPREILLVVDNCEHLIRDCAQYVEQLLGVCPKLKILATSIEALGIFNEVVWQVPSLALPEGQQNFSLEELHEFASIVLFNERANNVKAGFVLNDGNAISIAQICRRLDGIPLAIELAAARIKILSAEEIAARLDDRFSLLTAGSRTAMPRHQTLRATIDWSYDLLNETERILLRRLSIFAGGFTLEAVEAVCSEGMKQNDVLDLLGRLVDKSLVIVENDSGINETRYRLLETIRQYALQKMDETGEAIYLQNKHLEYFIKLAEVAEQNIFGTESVRFHKRLDLELDDIRMAMEWSIQSRQATAAFRLGAALFYFWYNRSSVSGEWQGQLNKALALAEGLERRPERANALNAMGFFYWADVIPINPRNKLEEALSIGKELGDKVIIARALCNLGLAESVDGKYVEARSLFEQSLDIFRELGSERKKEYVLSLTFLGDVAFNQGDMEGAQAYYEQSSSILKDIKDRNFLAYVVRRLGQLAWHQDKYEKAALLCKESLTFNQELEDERGVIASLSAFAGIVTAQGYTERAIQLFGAVETLLNSKNIRLIYMDRMEYDRNLTLLRGKLDEKTLVKFWNKGKEMSLEDVITFALEGT